MLFALVAAAVSTSTILAPFDFQVRPGSATWTVEAVGAPEDESHFELSALRIVERGVPERVIQTVALEEAETLHLNPQWIEAEDFDFDGWLDLSISAVGGSGGVPMLLLRFDPKRGRFLEPLGLTNASPDPERRVVDIGWRWGYCCGWDEEVRFIPGLFEPLVLKRVDRSRADGAGYVESVDKLVRGETAAPIIQTVEERDGKGRMRVVCRMELEDSVEQPVVKLLEGDPERCLRRE